MRCYIGVHMPPRTRASSHDVSAILVMAILVMYRQVQVQACRLLAPQHCWSPTKFVQDTVDKAEIGAVAECLWCDVDARTDDTHAHSPLPDRRGTPTTVTAVTPTHTTRRHCGPLLNESAQPMRLLAALGRQMDLCVWVAAPHDEVWPPSVADGVPTLLLTPIDVRM